MPKRSYLKDIKRDLAKKRIVVNDEFSKRFYEKSRQINRKKWLTKQQVKSIGQQATTSVINGYNAERLIALAFERCMIMASGSVVCHKRVFKNGAIWYEVGKAGTLREESWNIVVEKLKENNVVVSRGEPYETIVTDNYGSLDVTQVDFTKN